MKFYYRVLDELSRERKCFENIYKKTFSFPENTMFERSENMMIESVSYGECRRKARAAAAALRSRLGEYDRPVGLCMENCEEWAEAFWGLMLAGYIPLLINPAASESTVKSIMQQAGAEHILSNRGDGSISVRELIEQGGPEFECAFADEVILCTSGTTGKPKLCAYSGEQITDQLLNTRLIIKKTPEMKEEYDRHGRNLHILALLPFCHIFGLVANLFWFGIFSQTFVLLKDLSPSTIANTCRLHEVTHVFAPPVVWNTVEKGVIREAKRTGQYEKLMKGIRLSIALQSAFPALGRRIAGALFKDVQKQVFGTSIDYCISGGGNIKPQTLRLINGIGYFLTNGYGMTEIGICSYALTRRASGRITGSVGRPMPSVRFRISGEGNSSLEAAGAIYSAAYEGGIRIPREGEWYDTGDVFRVEKGEWFISGRRDDMINGENGERIGPDEIETLFDTPLAENICVYSGEREGIRETVLAAQPQSVRADIIRQLCSELKLQNDTHPLSMRVSRILIALKPLPIALNAKVNRRLVREGIENGDIPFKDAADALSTSESEAVSEAKVELTQAMVRCFSRALNIPEEKITENSSLVYDLSGSSLDYYMILEQVEKETGVKITPKDRVLSTPGEFADYILETGA